MFGPETSTSAQQWMEDIDMQVGMCCHVYMCMQW